MKIIFLTAIITVSAIASDPVFTSVSFYEGLGEKFRVETASAWPKCEESKRARKIFLHKKNELREVAYWDKAGKIHEAGANNNPHVHKIVNEIFAGPQTSGNPCLKEAPANDDAAKASEQ